MGKIAATLGKPLLPHQQYVADVALEIDNTTGYLAYDEVTVVGPRQTSGKTEQTLPIMAHRCTGFDDALVKWVRATLGLDVHPPGPQKVLYTAQTADAAREKWRDIHVERIRKSPLRAMWSGKPRLRLNAEAMFWQNGSVWSPGSTTGKTSGTGDTLDLALIDEAWSKTDARTELGLRPAMLTRPWRQLWCLSMVPGLSRVSPEDWPYLRQKMQTGRARVEADVRKGRAYFEWSADETADPHDPDTWWSCMPALGYMVPESSVATDLESMDLVDFCAEYLGWAPSGQMPMWSVVSEQTWKSLYDRGSYRDPVALAADATPELSAASIGMAAIRPDGDPFVELIERRAGVAWVLDALLALCRSHSVCAVAIDRNGPLAGLRMPLRRAMAEESIDVQLVEFNSAEVAAACAQLFNETGELDDASTSVSEDDPPPTTLRVRHLAQPELDAAIGGAIQYRFGDRWRWSRAGSSVDVSPLYAVTLARAAGDQVEWIGGRYDIRDSLG